MDSVQVCYAYDGIGRVIMEMTPSDWASWVGAIGTLAAVWSAVWLYRRSRLDAQKDADTKRRILQAMLEEHVRAVVTWARGAHEFLKRVDAVGFWKLSTIHRLNMSPENPDRLIELQGTLVSVGDVGDEAIAAFIESFREYTSLNRHWQQLIEQGEMSEESAEVMTHWRSRFEDHLSRLNETATPAFAAIRRFDKR